MASGHTNLMHEINASDIGQLLSGRMGLIIGPSVTKYPGCLSDLVTRLAEKRGLSPGGTYLDIGDQLLEQGVNEVEVADKVRDIVAHQQASSVLGHLSKARWAAVLSAALDAHFEDGLQHEATRQPGRQLITVLSQLTIPYPPRTIPVYKLLGMLMRDGFAFSTVGYLSRRATWRYAVKGFADLIKGNPVLCLGMADCVWVLLDLINEMLGERTAAPSSLLLLADDPICTNAKLQQLVKHKVRLVRLRGTVGDVARFANAAAKLGYAQSLPFPATTDAPFSSLRPYADLVAIVNEHLETPLTKAENNQLLDLLFAPSVARWDPYVLAMDFPRSLGPALISESESALKNPDKGSLAGLVTGSAVTGKTVALKRLAWQLAKSGAFVLWMKPWTSSDTSRPLRELFQAVAALKPWEGHRVVVVMDDPLGFGSVSPREVANAAAAAELRILLITAVRTSEYRAWELSDLVGSLPLVFHQELPDALDDIEWSRLPDYLVTLGVKANRAEAERELIGVKNQSAQDILSALYYLLPHTRVAIGSSIRHEYFRLGDVAGLTTFIAGAAQSGTELLKRAYEMVAVADRYRGRLPMEVLVSALGVDYGEWINATGANSAAWGLLYAEDLQENQTVWYRTRNAIVTRTIVETLNGGTIGRTGELKVLTELLGACNRRTSPVYREFCARVLVPAQKLDELEYEEGVRLYETALEALPFPDRTLLHHRGLWEKNRGNNAIGALAILEKALHTKDYPYTNRGEAEEHIHTTMAATLLDGISAGSVPLDQGKKDILDHLAKARSTSFFNPRSVHVQANLISHLADKEAEKQGLDYFTLLNKAVADLDHTLLLLQSPVTYSSQVVGDVRALESIRETVLLKAAVPEELQKQAVELWNKYRSQEGFVLAARKLYAIAQEKNKKFELAFACAQQAIATVEEAGEAPIPALLAVSLQIYYHWRVRRQIISGINVIGWEFLRDQSIRLLSSPQFAADALHRYIHALALAHLGDWRNANVVFAHLRQTKMPSSVLWTPRDFLLDSSGGIRSVQGILRAGSDRSYLFVEDLGADFHLSREGRWPRDGEIAHAQIEFSFGGPRAISVM